MDGASRYVVRSQHLKTKPASSQLVEVLGEETGTRSSSQLPTSNTGRAQAWACVEDCEAHSMLGQGLSLRPSALPGVYVLGCRPSVSCPASFLAHWKWLLPANGRPCERSRDRQHLRSESRSRRSIRMQVASFLLVSRNSLHHSLFSGFSLHSMTA